MSSKLISSLFPDEVLGTILPIADYTHHLHPAELKIICTASEKRKNEFSTGRFCAKKTLTLLDVTVDSILSGTEREPVWPTGIIGSITHCKDFGGAVLARSGKLISIGFDMENIKVFREDIAKFVCTGEEREWIHEQERAFQKVLILLIFSIKESIYKCMYPVSKSKVGFQAYSICPNLDSNTATLSMNSRQQIPELNIRFNITQRHIYSCAFL